jgi:hypothetical protein
MFLLLLEFPCFKVVSSGMIVHKEFIGIMQGHPGSIGLLQRQQTRTIKVLLASSMSISFGPSGFFSVVIL